MIPRNVKSRDLVGKEVETTREIQTNAGFILPTGSLVSIVGFGRAFDIVSEKCECCGVAVHVRGVKRCDVRLIIAPCAIERKGHSSGGVNIKDYWGKPVWIDNDDFKQYGLLEYDESLEDYFVHVVSVLDVREERRCVSGLYNVRERKLLLYDREGGVQINGRAKKGGVRNDS